MFSPYLLDTCVQFGLVFINIVETGLYTVSNLRRVFTQLYQHFSKLLDLANLNLLSFQCRLQCLKLGHGQSQLKGETILSSKFVPLSNMVLFSFLYILEKSTKNELQFHKYHLSLSKGNEKQSYFTTISSYTLNNVRLL